MSEPKSIVQWNVSFAGLVIAVALVIGAIVYFVSTRSTTPERPLPELNFFEQYLVSEASTALAEGMPAIEGIHAVAFIPVRDEHARSGIAVEAFHKALRDSGRYQSLSQEAVDAGIAKLLPEGGEVTTPEQVARLLTEILVDRDGKPVADAALLTSAEIEGRIGDQARVFIQAELVTRDGRPVIADGLPKAETSRIESRLSYAWFVGWMNEISWGYRMIFWATLIGLLPFGLASLVRAITKRESNRHNAYLVLAFSAFSGLLAWFLVGFYIHSLASGMAVFLGLLIGSFYSLWACSTIDEKSR